jgi:hypothetical protein
LTASGGAGTSVTVKSCVPVLTAAPTPFLTVTSNVAVV